MRETIKEEFKMDVTRRLIKWCDTKFSEALHEEDDRRANAKAFASGAVEGFMNVAVVLYLPLLVTCYYYKCKSAKK